MIRSVNGFGATHNDVLSTCVCIYRVGHMLKDDCGKVGRSMCRAAYGYRFGYMTKFNDVYKLNYYDSLKDNPKT